MRIENTPPPNRNAIEAVGLYRNDNIYAYGNTIYNPSGAEIPTDIVFHETIHANRQKGNPELWWHKYLTDKEFRKEEELYAYYSQYQFLKRSRILREKELRLALEEFAQNLSIMYNLDISIPQAITALRKYRAV